MNEADQIEIYRVARMLLAKHPSIDLTSRKSVLRALRGLGFDLRDRAEFSRRERDGGIQPKPYAYEDVRRAGLWYRRLAEMERVARADNQQLREAS